MERTLADLVGTTGKGRLVSVDSRAAFQEDFPEGAPCPFDVVSESSEGSDSAAMEDGSSGGCGWLSLSAIGKSKGVFTETPSARGDFTRMGGLCISDDAEDALDDGLAWPTRKFGAIGDTDRRFKDTIRLEVVSDSQSDLFDFGARPNASDGDNDEIDD